LEKISNKKGKLVIFTGPGAPLELKEYQLPDLQPGELLIKNCYTTLCGSDLHTYGGLRKETCPTVLGHEIVGEVVAIDTAHNGQDLAGCKIETGDLVTWTVFSSDPKSLNALRGIPQKGDRLFKYGHALVNDPDVFHGGLSEYCILKANTGILKLPQDMPVDIAATINCSVSTVAAAMRMAGELKDKTILITGMGHLGLTAAAWCREAGAQKIIAADVSAKRLLEAVSFGAHVTLNMNEAPETQLEWLMKETSKNGVDIVFDMSGAPAAMEMGIQSLGIAGTAVWVGAVFNSRPLQINAENIIRKLISIKGIHNYNFTDFKNAFDFLKCNWKKYPFGRVVEKEFPLDQVNEAFEYAIHAKPLRVGIRLKK
jgi:putative phosphonate catabolism associated alcohol dehydrogenase